MEMIEITTSNSTSENPESDFEHFFIVEPLPEIGGNNTIRNITKFETHETPLYSF